MRLKTTYLDNVGFNVVLLEDFWGSDTVSYHITPIRFSSIDFSFFLGWVAEFDHVYGRFWDLGTNFQINSIRHVISDKNHLHFLGYLFNASALNICYE